MTRGRITFTSKPRLGDLPIEDGLTEMITDQLEEEYKSELSKETSQKT